MSEQVFGASVKACNLREGDWMVFNNPRFNCRVVSVEFGGDLVLVRTDFGNGGEPATHFYEQNEYVKIGN
jgi:hypothetical protein